MKKYLTRVFRIWGITAIVLSMSASMAINTFAYNGNAAAQYAKNWYDSANSSYNDYHGRGGDCTNFASQCVYAGGAKEEKPSKMTPDSVLKTKTYWFSDKYIRTNYFLGFKVSSYPVWAESSSWVRVAGGYGFYDYWKQEGKTLIVSSDLSYIRSQARVGDVIQVQAKGSSAKGHSTIVGAKANGEITLYYHSSDTYKTLAAFDKAYGKGSGTNTYTIIRM